LVVVVVVMVVAAVVMVVLVVDAEAGLERVAAGGLRQPTRATERGGAA